MGVGESGSLPFSLLLVAGCILVVAFFSSSEASLIAVNRVRVRHRAEAGSKAAQAVTRVVAKHEKFFATILLTENAFIVLSTSVGTAVIISLLGDSGASIALATVVMTVLVVIFGEITPKSLAVQVSDRWALVVARPIEVIMALETVVIYLFTLLPRLIRWLMGGQGALTSPSVTEGDLRMLIDIAQTEGMVHPAEAQLLERVFQFGDRQVREVITPRTEVVWVEKGATIEQFLSLYARYPYSRFPIYEGDFDNVVGILSVKDVLRAMAEEQIQRTEDVTTLGRPALFVPEAKLVSELLGEFQASKSTMAIVVDEFGGVDGVATLTQLLEVVVGPVAQLEGMLAEEEFKVIDGNTFEVDGGVRVEEVNQRLELALPEGEYETIAGFILDAFGHIPHEGETCETPEANLRVAEMRGVKIEKVHISRSAPAASPEAE